MLEEGLLSTMQYFQRIVYQAVFDLRKVGTSPQEYFRKNIFEDLDDYIFYMFRLYQATQARMNDGLTIAIQNRIIVLEAILGCSLFLYFSILCYWFYKTKREK